MCVQARTVEVSFDEGGQGRDGRNHARDWGIPHLSRAAERKYWKLSPEEREQLPQLMCARFDALSE
jgi:hypothetical protein